MKIDFHVHTNSSKDSSISPKDLIKKSKETGIIPCITDHNSLRSNKIMKELNSEFVPGEEIKTDVGDLIGYYLTEEIPRKTPFLEALDKIKEQGGISCLPHGFDKWRYAIGEKYPEYAKKVQIIEVFNARCVSPEFNKKAEEFADKYNKLKTAGSDSHFLFEFGKTYSEVPDFDLTEPKEFLNALKKIEIHGKYAPKYVKGTTALFSRLRKIKRLLFNPGESH